MQPRGFYPMLFRKFSTCLVASLIPTLFLHDIVRNNLNALLGNNFNASLGSTKAILTISDGRSTRNQQMSTILYNRVPKTGSSSLMDLVFKEANFTRCAPDIGTFGGFGYRLNTLLSLKIWLDIRYGLIWCGTPL